MGVIVGLLYITVLSIVMIYAVGGISLPIIIVAVLGYILISELSKAHGMGDHPEVEEHSKRYGHHVH